MLQQSRAFTGVEESLGWTKGSMIEEQPWHVRHLVDSFTSLFMYFSTLLAGLAWGCIVLYSLVRQKLRRRGTPATNKKRQ